MIKTSMKSHYLTAESRIIQVIIQITKIIRITMGERMMGQMKKVVKTKRRKMRMAQMKRTPMRTMISGVLIERA